MKIAFVYTHHRRTLNTYYKCAAERLRHDVCSVGPWDDHLFGTYGREPTVELSDRMVRHYAYAELRLPWQPDVLWLLEGGEDLRVTDIPRDVAFVHQSVEGANMGWSRGITPHRYVNFTCNGYAPPDVQFLPYGFDPTDTDAYSPRGPLPTAEREYDCAQIGSARPTRVALWDYVRAHGFDVHCWFSPSLWGPAHFALYQNARCTFANQTKDFMCPRVFDAMAMGCVLVSDRVPSLLSLFEDGVHFVGYDPLYGADGEAYPDPEWLLDVIRRCRREPSWAQRIATAAHKEVTAKHSYEHRVRTVLSAL